MPWLFNKVSTFRKLFTWQLLWNWFFLSSCSSVDLMKFHPKKHSLVFEAVRGFLCQSLQLFSLHSSLFTSTVSHKFWPSQPPRTVVSLSLLIRSVRLFWGLPFLYHNLDFASSIKYGQFWRAPAFFSFF